MIKINEMNLRQIEERKAQIMDILHDETSEVDLDLLDEEIDELETRKKELKSSTDERRRKMTQVANDPFARVVASFPKEERNDLMEGEIKMDKIEEMKELRSFQKYVTGAEVLEAELRAINVNGSAAVIPVSVSDKLIKDEKYSDLLNRATVFTEENSGTLNIPVSSSNSADWKEENANADDKSPELTQISLSGYELVRYTKISAASRSLSAGQFESILLELLSSEVIETLEKSFIAGTGTGQPQGLNSLTFTEGDNWIKADQSIQASDLAKGLSLLMQKYSRNAIILVNADTLFQISQFKGTTEYAFNLTDGATKFMGKEISVNEHLSNNVIYILDPKELYVRFSHPLTVEADRSSGFRSASIDLRALAVVDAKWNPKAVVKVSL